MTLIKGKFGVHRENFTSLLGNTPGAGAAPSITQCSWEYRVGIRSAT